MHTIGTSGKVMAVSIDSDSLRSDNVAACVTQLIQFWRVRFSPDLETAISLPLVFSLE